MTILKKVQATVETLRAMSVAELTAWAKNNGMDSAAGFSNFKKALKTVDVDYDAMRQARNEAREANKTPADRLWDTTRSIASALRTASFRADMVNAVPASDKQINFLARLLAEAGEDGSDWRLNSNAVLTSRMASALIGDSLKSKAA